MPALLSAAELFLRGTMDLRHKHWREPPPSGTRVRDMVEQARGPLWETPQLSKMNKMQRVWLYFPLDYRCLLAAHHGVLAMPDSFLLTGPASRSQKGECMHL